MRKSMIFLSLCMTLAWQINTFAYVTEARNPSEAGRSEAALNGYSEEEWAKLMDNVLEYSEIEDLVKNFNVNISSAWSKFNENIDSLNTAIDTLKAAKREMEGLETSAKDSGDIVNTMLYKAQGKGLGISIQAMSTSRDKLSREITSTNAAIRNAQSQVVAGVQSLMIGYKNMEAHEEILDNMVKMYEEALNTANQSANLGLSTNIDITKAMSDLSNARASLLSLRANKEKLYRSLITICGWNPDASVTVGDIPSVNDDEIKALNPSIDINIAIGNNDTLIKKRHNTSSKSTTFVDAKLYQSSKDEDMLRANINQMYDKILADKKALEAAEAGNEAAKATENALDTQKSLGVVSSVQYLGGKVSILQKQAELTSAVLELRTDYNTYIQALDGNASVE